MSDTGTPLNLPLMPIDGARTPEVTFNEAMAILNGSALVDERTASEVSITGAVTLDSDAFGKMHVITGTSADYSITLFTPTSDDLGKIIGFRVSNAGTKVYTLDAAGSETIDGSTTLALRKDDVVYLKAISTTGNTWQVVLRKYGTVPMPVYGITGTLQANPHMVVGAAALSGGSATVNLTGAAIFTSDTTYQVSASNFSNANPFKIFKNSGSQFTITGTGTDIIAFICVGN